LTLRVKRTGGCSDKALGLDEHGLGAGTPYAGFNGGSLDAVSLADDDDFLAG
jgi:hypothetical protein